MDLKDIYMFFTVQGYPPGLQVLSWILPFDYLPSTKDDVAIQDKAYNYVNKHIVEPLLKIISTGYFGTFQARWGTLKILQGTISLRSRAQLYYIPGPNHTTFQGQIQQHSRAQ